MSTKLRPLVYIAGPIRKGDLGDNIANAFEAFYALKNAGYSPICPHLSCFLDTPRNVRTSLFYDGTGKAFATVPGVTFDEWMEIDLSIVAKCDAVLRLDGESEGADRECDFAFDCRINIIFQSDFKSISDAVKGIRFCLNPSSGRPREDTVSRASILDKAGSAINGQRDQDYGSPEDNFGRIAQSWTWYLTSRGLIQAGSDLDGFDVALMMDLLKTARLINNPKSVDGWVDKAGYAACGGEIACKSVKE